MLLRQLSDEESLLFPHDATAAPFIELSNAHARLYVLAQRLEEMSERCYPLHQLRVIVDDLVATLRSHLAEEEAVLAALPDAGGTVPSAAALNEAHRHWTAVQDDGPVVIPLDGLPTSLATHLCIERVLRLHPGERAVISSCNRAQLHDVRTWLHQFERSRFAFATTLSPDQGMRLDVARRRGL